TSETDKIGYCLDARLRTGGRDIGNTANNSARCRPGVACMSMHMSVAPLRALDRIGCSLLGQRDCTRSKRHCLQRASLGVTEETIEDDQCSRRSRSISAQ